MKLSDSNDSAASFSLPCLIHPSNLPSYYGSLIVGPLARLQSQVAQTKTFPTVSRSKPRIPFSYYEMLLTRGNGEIGERRASSLLGGSFICRLLTF